MAITDNARAFLIAVAGDEDFANDFLQAIDGLDGMQQAEKTISFATARGYELDLDDLVSVADDEKLAFLEDADLDAVAGGQSDVSFDDLSMALRDALRVQELI